MQQHLTVHALDAHDPIGRPSSVHFNSTAGYANGAGDDSATTVTTTTTTTGATGEMESYEIRTDLKHKTLIQIHHAASPAAGQQPFAVLPPTAADGVDGPARHGPSPAPRRRFYASTGDLTGDFGDRPPVNPRSTQRGLLRIVAHGDPPIASTSKIPRRKSITASQENLMHTPTMKPSATLPTARRTSISPGRRTSNAGLRAQKTHHASIPQPHQHQPIDLGIVAGGGSGGGGRSTNVSRSNSRISRPTTLSPIIGTPNKDSEQEDGTPTKPRSTPQSRTTTTTTIVADVNMSPTKIPVSTALSRRNSGATAASRNVSRANSTATSRANSREPSPGASLRAPAAGSASKPVSRSSSNRSTTSARTATRKEATGKPKPGVKPSASGRTSAKDPKPDYLNKPTALKREPSGVKRSGSTLARSTSNLRREKSTLKPSDSAAKLKRENSSVRKAAAPTDPVKRQTSRLALPTAQLTKNKSDSQLNKRLEKQGSFRSEKGSDKPVANGKPVIGSSDSSEKLVPPTKPNGVSMTTAAITAQPVAITTAVSNTSSGSASESDATAGGVAATNDTAAAAAETAKANGAADATAPIQSPALILEHSQKALECIQKTMLEATDEITRTIEGNLTDLKSLETDLRTGAEPGTTGRPPPPVMLEKKTSTRSLVRNASAAALQGVPEAANESQAMAADVVVHAPGDAAGPMVSGAVDTVRTGAGAAGGDAGAGGAADDVVKADG